MKVDRGKTCFRKMTDEDDGGYVDASPEECLNMMWELTAEIWSLIDKEAVERPLRRDITKLIRPGDGSEAAG